MGFYNRFVLPRLIEFAMHRTYLEALRQRAAGVAGPVLPSCHSAIIGLDHACQRFNRVIYETSAC